MTLYIVRFCDKELIAYNLRDFARIAVFAKWYLRSQSLSEGMQCSVKEQELPASRYLFDTGETSPMPVRPRRLRSPRRASMRKALRSFFYSVFC